MHPASKWVQHPPELSVAAGGMLQGPAWQLPPQHSLQGGDQEGPGGGGGAHQKVVAAIPPRHQCGGEAVLHAPVELGGEEVKLRLRS